MPNLRLIAVNAAGGAGVNVLATIPSRRVEAMEDEGNNNAPQGFSVQTPLDNFTNNRGLGPGSEPLIIQNSVAQGRGASPIIGLPAQGTAGQFNARAADPLLKNLVSLAAATTVAVTEME